MFFRFFSCPIALMHSKRKTNLNKEFKEAEELEQEAQRRAQFSGPINPSSTDSYVQAIKKAKMFTDK